MSPAHRLVLNTLVTYARSVFGLALGLFSSRWVLNALGQSDFGLFSIVGSILIFITFLNNLLAGSAARYFAYSIGEGKTDEVRKWFNSALSVHVCLAVILILIGWPIGEYVISHYINIPLGRMNAALWVFRISLVSAFFNMISIPFGGMFTAKQRIAELALYGLFQSLIWFSFSYSLFYINHDKLIVYSIGVAVIMTTFQMIIIIRALFTFRECQIRITEWLNRGRMTKMASFACWNLIGSSGALLRDQGTALLLNHNFGTTVNAAYGIAGNVSNQTNQLSSAMMGAFSPEITSSEGRGDRQRMLMLAERANKFGTILVLLFTIPLFLEMDYVLTLWLKTPPQYTAEFCKLILTTFIIDRLTSGYMLAVAAHGKIAAYQLTVGGLLVLTLPIAWIFIKLGCSPTSVGIAFISTMILCSLERVVWMKKLMGVPMKQWIKKTLVPCITVTLITSSIGLGFSTILSPSLFHLICICILTFGTTLMASWVFAIDKNERIFLKNAIKRVFEKFKMMRLFQ